MSSCTAWTVINLQKAVQDILGRENNITQKDRVANNMTQYTNYSGMAGIWVKVDYY